MLTITFTNITPGEEQADYTARISVNGQFVANGFVRGHYRINGWRTLLRMAADVCGDWESIPGMETITREESGG